MTDLLALTGDLVDIASESLQEGQITDYVVTTLTGIPGLQVDRLGNNVVARTNLGRGTRLVLAGHSDTVPINANVPARRDGDTVWGCGAADMKSGLAVMLELARTITEPAVDVTYVFYEAEEIASVHNGLARLFAERPEWLRGDVALLGEPTNGDIEAGCQGTMRLQVTMHGVRAHSARPWMGRNAIHRAGAVIERVAAWEGRRPVIEGCEYREALQVVAVSGGVAGNVIPDSCSLTLNHRFAPDRTAAQAESQVREILELDDDDTLEITDVAPAARPGLDHPLLRALIERNDLTVRAKVAWTDVARFAEHGIPASNFGPGDATLAHTADERVERRVIERTYAALAALLTSGA